MKLRLRRISYKYNLELNVGSREIKREKEN